MSNCHITNSGHAGISHTITNLFLALHCINSKNTDDLYYKDLFHPFAGFKYDALFKLEQAKPLLRQHTKRLHIRPVKHF